LGIALSLVLIGCGHDETGITGQTPVSTTTPALQKSVTGGTGSAMLSTINAKLESQGKSCRVLMMEYITAPASEKAGTIVYARDVGNKQLSAHWVPFDPRRGAGTRVITYAVDRTEGAANGGLTAAQTETAIDNAMGTWNTQPCASIPITKTNLGFIDLGYVQYLLGFGGIAGWGADITHAGWLPGTFFDLVEQGGSGYILGVTFTFIWVESSGPTDIDHNGKADVAFREIYYNDAFPWSVAGPAWYDPQIDVESIALHETGHGLSQAHFGMVFFDASKKFTVDHLHFAPRAVMNAVYWDTQRVLLGSDGGGFCSIWASWPKN